MKIDPINYLLLYIHALSSANNATELGATGIPFNRFGRRHGWKMILHFMREGINYLIDPVSSTRYFEFPFALSSLPPNPNRCLDVSSPSVFSFYVSQKIHPTSIWMINPDPKDIQLSAKVVKRLKISNIRTDCLGVDILENTQESFDCIWAISVVEHISGKYDDRYAVKLMFNALDVGGHLILTIPVDRKFWTEYRTQEFYSKSNSQQDPRGYFFQRYYDKAAIWERIISTIGLEPSSVRWFGEKEMGHFVEYEQRWLNEGLYCTVDDPLDMVENYQEYPSWELMPGKGVCGLLFIKPRDG